MVLILLLLEPLLRCGWANHTLSILYSLNPSLAGTTSPIIMANRYYTFAELVLILLLLEPLLRSQVKTVHSQFTTVVLILLLLEPLLRFSNKNLRGKDRVVVLILLLLEPLLR